MFTFIYCLLLFFTSGYDGEYNQQCDAALSPDWKPRPPFPGTYVLPTAPLKHFTLLSASLLAVSEKVKHYDFDYSPCLAGFIACVCGFVLVKNRQRTAKQWPQWCDVKHMSLRKGWSLVRISTEVQILQISQHHSGCWMFSRDSIRYSKTWERF